MADEAGPSGAPKAQLSEEELKVVDEKFEKGVACIQSNDLDTAVALLEEVLKARVNHYGGIAPETASAYYRYGSALLYQAQESADVFGGPINGAAGAEEDKENGLAAKEDDTAGGYGDAIDDATATADAGEGSGAAPATGDDAAAVEGDLQLAWENLETARAIWARDAATHATELASVHMLLGDVAAENEAFEDALADYDAALEHQAAAGMGGAHRSVAQVHFKRCMAAQFLGRSDDALTAVREAVATLQRVQAAGGDGAADVGELLAELNDKVEELEAEAAEAAATKAAMRSAMTQLQAAMAEQMGANGAGGSGSGAGASNVLGAAGGDAPRPPGASPVKDLGVVGRGTKRINLAPVGGAPAGGAAPDAPTEPAAKKKRSLEDLMGGTDASEGFGAAPAAPAAPAEKTEKAEEPQKEAAPMPAFLQAYTKKD